MQPCTRLVQPCLNGPVRGSASAQTCCAPSLKRRDPAMLDARALAGASHHSANDAKLAPACNIYALLHRSAVRLALRLRAHGPLTAYQDGATVEQTLNVSSGAAAQRRARAHRGARHGQAPR
jgi:hypothetical protein